MDFDGEDEEENKEEGGKEGANALEGLDGVEKDKQAVPPLIIDGLEVDREVRSLPACVSVSVGESVGVCVTIS